MLQRLGSLMKRRRWWIIAGLILVIAAATTVRALAVNGSVFYIDNTSAPVIEGIQNGGGDGMEGVVGSTAGAIGILGFENNATNQGIGLEGLDEGPSSTGLYGQDLNSNTSLPGVGLLGTSTSGVGMKGESLLGTGIGVLGVDSATGLQVGELGINGGAGMSGSSGSGEFETPGIDGESSDNDGVDSAGGFGLDALTTGPGTGPGFGVLGLGLQAVSGFTMNIGSNFGGIGVVGGEFSGTSSNAGDFNIGVLGESDFGQGVVAEVNSAVPSSPLYGAGNPIALYSVAATGTSLRSGEHAYGGVVEAQDRSTFGFAVFNSSSSAEVDIVPSGTTTLMDGEGTSGSFSFDESGDETLSGHITTAGGTLIEPRGNSGTRHITYAAQSTVPALEDYGEAQLINGHGHVFIDAALADALDSRANYLVFITPEGDSNGLFVTGKNRAGFDVRENRGGRDSLTFSYRIISKPAGEDGDRLAVASPPVAQRGVLSIGHARHFVIPVAEQEVRGILTPGERARLAKYRLESQARAEMIRRLPGVDASGRLHLGAVIVRTPH
jgi:hypothetical protein